MADAGHPVGWGHPGGWGHPWGAVLRRRRRVAARESRRDELREARRDDFREDRRGDFREVLRDAFREAAKGESPGVAEAESVGTLRSRGGSRPLHAAVERAVPTSRLPARWQRHRRWPAAASSRSERRKCSEPSEPSEPAQRAQLEVPESQRLPSFLRHAPGLRTVRMPYPRTVGLRRPKLRPAWPQCSRRARTCQPGSPATS